VALGCLVSAAAHESPLLEALQRLFTRLGLPTAPEHLGLHSDVVAEAIRRAPSMRPERYTVLSQLGRDIPDAEELIRRGCLAPGVPAAL
jgi:glycerol-1-phosphate dehydrogenase [NAD(P)+]